MINTTKAGIRTSPSHNGRYHRSDRKEVLEFLQESSNLTMTQVANQFNLSPSTVHHWVHRYLSKTEAQSIVQRGHDIRGEQIAKHAKYRAHMQQERINNYNARKTSKVSASLKNSSEVKQTLLNMKAQIEEMLKHV